MDFSRDGKQFITGSYDRFIKLWDTETGQCITKLTNRKIPYCLKFNPDENRQHLFLAGCNDKKVSCWDTRSGNIVQVSAIIDFEPIIHLSLFSNMTGI